MKWHTFRYWLVSALLVLFGTQNLLLVLAGHYLLSTLYLHHILLHHIEFKTVVQHLWRLIAINENIKDEILNKRNKKNGGLFEAIKELLKEIRELFRNA